MNKNSQAQQLLAKHGLTTNVKFKGVTRPDWEDEYDRFTFMVTIKSPTDSYSFPYYTSRKDFADQNKRVNLNEILSSIYFDASVEDTIEEFANEYYGEKMSFKEWQRVHEAYTACCAIRNFLVTAVPDFWAFMKDLWEFENGEEY